MGWINLLVAASNVSMICYENYLKNRNCHKMKARCRILSPLNDYNKSYLNCCKFVLLRVVSYRLNFFYQFIWQSSLDYLLCSSIFFNFEINVFPGNNYECFLPFFCEFIYKLGNKNILNKSSYEKCEIYSNMTLQWQ